MHQLSHSVALVQTGDAVLMEMRAGSGYSALVWVKVLYCASWDSPLKRCCSLTNHVRNKSSRKSFNI